MNDFLIYGCHSWMKTTNERYGRSLRQTIEAKIIFNVLDGIFLKSCLEIFSEGCEQSNFSNFSFSQRVEVHDSIIGDPQVQLYHWQGIPAYIMTFNPNLISYFMHGALRACKVHNLRWCQLLFWLFQCAALWPLLSKIQPEIKISGQNYRMNCSVVMNMLIGFPDDL